MKRLLVFSILLMVAIATMGAGFRTGSKWGPELRPGVATYPPAVLGSQYGTFITGPGGEPEGVSAAHPMPVAGASAKSATSSCVLVSSIPQTWTLSASTTDFFLQGLGTSPFWVDFNQVATIGQCMFVSASGTVGRDAAEGFMISIVASPSTYFYKVQGLR